ncbi:MAG: methionyl-tRNA formyltransferase [Alphaproteobacteria bacterium]|nr:methionyl-tRNA formyltransferase [Alphaproteobacteria bacterium]
MGQEVLSPQVQALVAAGHTVAQVYSQPPKPTGRGHKTTPTAVHAAAETMGLPVRTPKTLRDEQEHDFFAALQLDAAVVVAYGLILPRQILSASRMGCLNIHASLLPRWRGAAPLHRAILAGDAETGITIMQMDEGLDTGPMLLWGKIPISETTTTPQLHDALAPMGADLIVAALHKLQAGEISPTPQPTTGITYAAKLSKDEGRIDWAMPAPHIGRMVRALAPWPGCFFEWRGERIKLLEALPAAGSGPPGTVLHPRGIMACGQGALHLLKVQRPDRAPVSGEEFLRTSCPVSS